MDRRLGLGLQPPPRWSAQVIAVGIFLTPAAMATDAGLAAPGCWPPGSHGRHGARRCALLTASSRLASPRPAAATSTCARPTAARLAFLYGWKCLLVMDPGITAALAAGIASYAAYLVPMGPATMKLVAVGAILVAAALNIVGSQTGASVAGRADACSSSARWR